jgi:hemerythrin-like domain-containing protein
MNILVADHDTLRKELAALHKIGGVLDYPESLMHEVRKGWREIQKILRDIHLCFSVTLPRHHQLEENLLYLRMLPRLNHTDAILLKEIISEHQGLNQLSGVLAELIAPWAERTTLPPRVDVWLLIALTTELQIHLSRHMQIEEEKIYPLAAQVLSPRELAQVELLQESA